MTTQTNITIYAGATFSQALTVASTAGKTYRAKVVDREWFHALDLSISVDSATQITISLTADQTGSIGIPNALAKWERSCLLGYWDLEEVDGTSVSRLFQGQVNYSREATT